MSVHSVFIPSSLVLAFPLAYFLRNRLAAVFHRLRACVGFQRAARGLRRLPPGASPVRAARIMTRRLPGVLGEPLRARSYEARRELLLPRVTAVLREMDEAGLDVCRIEGFEENRMLYALRLRGYYQGVDGFVVGLSCCPIRHDRLRDLGALFNRRFGIESDLSLATVPDRRSSDAPLACPSAAPGTPVDFELFENLRVENARVHAELELRRRALARVLHDLRMPLSALILGHETTVRRLDAGGVDAEELRGRFRRTERQLETLELFSRDLLELLVDEPDSAPTPARAQDGGSAFWCGNFDEAVSDCVEVWREALESRPIRVELETAAGGECRVRASHLKRVVQNLLVGTLKFCAPPGRVVLKTRRSGDLLTLEYADTGPAVAGAGGAVRELARRNVGRAGNGWGLGLAAAESLATEMGGRLSMIGAGEGYGARFLLVLPAEAG